MLYLSTPRWQNIPYDAVPNNEIKAESESPFFYSFVKILFIYFKRDKVSGGGAQRERERESQTVSMPPVQSPMQGSNPQNHEIMT